VKLVMMLDGRPQVRWTWFPYWIAANARAVKAVEAEVARAQGLGEDDLHKLVCAHLQSMFPGVIGLSAFLDSAEKISLDA
jgi:hypothetical protein